MYVQYDGYALILTTENGLGPSNTIHLEPEVVASVLDFALKLPGFGPWLCEAVDRTKTDILRHLQVRETQRAVDDIESGE